MPVLRNRQLEISSTFCAVSKFMMNFCKFLTLLLADYVATQNDKFYRNFFFGSADSIFVSAVTKAHGDRETNQTDCPFIT